MWANVAKVVMKIMHVSPIASGIDPWIGWLSIVLHSLGALDKHWVHSVDSIRHLTWIMLQQFSFFLEFIFSYIEKEPKDQRPHQRPWPSPPLPPNKQAERKEMAPWRLGHYNHREWHSMEKLLGRHNDQAISCEF